MFFSFEHLGRFDPPMAQTKCLTKRKSSSHFQADQSLCGSIFSYFSQLRTALFTRIISRCILELLVDILPTFEQRISVIAPARAFI